MSEIVAILAQRPSLLGRLCASVDRVQVVDAVASEGGISVQPEARRQESESNAAQAIGEAMTLQSVLTVSRKVFRFIRAEVHAGRGQNALLAAQFGLEEAIKDNFIRSFRQDERIDRRNIDEIASIHSSFFVDFFSSPATLPKLVAVNPDQ